MESMYGAPSEQQNAIINRHDRRVNDQRNQELLQQN
jgi:hypothetical protein